MPVILQYKGFRFFFFSNEGDPREPVHIHVRKGDAIAKFWLQPNVAVAFSHGLTSKDLKELLAVIEAKKNFIERSWHEYFGE